MSAEMPGLGNQRYLLDRVADLDTEPSVVLVRHVGADDTVHNSPIGVCPGNAAWANIRSEFDETFTSKSVEVKPQAVLHRTLDRDIRLAFLSSLKIGAGITTPRSAACRAVCLLGAWGESLLVMPGQELGEIRRRKRELKSLTRVSETQTMPVGCLYLPGIPYHR